MLASNNKEQDSTPSGERIADIFKVILFTSSVLEFFGLAQLIKQAAEYS